MPSQTEVYANYKIDGLKKIIALGKAMCRIVVAFKVIILAKYPDSPNIAALLAAIEAMCALLYEAEAEMVPAGGNNSGIIMGDPIVGVDEGADDPVYPEE